jgi:signal recognition particle subunit SRP68
MIRVDIYNIDFAKINAKLLNYSQNLRLKKYIEKNLVYINDYAKDFNDNLISDMLEKDNIKFRCKPQEMIKLYNNLIEYQNQLISLEKENPDQAQLTELHFSNGSFTTSKIFYVALTYLMNKKYEDVYTLLHYLLEKIKEVNEYFEVHNLESLHQLVNDRDQMNSLESKAEFLINKCYVKMNREAINNAKMIVDSEAKKKRMQGWLLEMIEKKNKLDGDTFDLFKERMKISYDEYLENIEKMNYNNYTHLAQLPPNVSLINPKPISYDLTFQRFQYPNLEERMKKQDKGILGKAFGYFFGK